MEEIQNLIAQYAIDNEISCLKASEIANELKISAEEIGRNLDLLGIRITQCQLGLFGYKPHKKIVKPSNDINLDLKRMIEKSLTANNLPCKSAWEIAHELKIGKIAVSSVCETLGVKIKPCQLGAF